MLNDVCSRIVIPERLARQIVDVVVMFSRVSSVETVVIINKFTAWVPRPTREDFNDASQQESRSHSCGHA